MKQESHVNPVLKAGIAAAAIALTAPVSADMFDDVNVVFNGFTRVEAAYKTTGDQNPYNQRGNIFNGVDIRRNAGNPLTNYDAPLSILGLQGLAENLPVVGPILTELPLLDGTLPVTDVVSRDVPKADDEWNYLALRTELGLDISFGSNWTLKSRLRALYDPGVYDAFDARDYSDVNGGIRGGDPGLYHGKPNYYEYRVEGDSNPIPLEWNGRDYMIDFPALFLEYSEGSLTVRAGNQQIAWGQTIFFRVMDVPNGLDLRRHLILDRGLEEYSDERVPSLAVRLGYQLTQNVLLDSYVQKFQPTIFPNTNTPYNVIPAQFTVHDLYDEAGYSDKLSYGLRLKGDWGQWGVQAVVARRWNPDGAFRWTNSDVNKPLANDTLLGAVFNQYCNVVLGTINQGCGPLLAETPFEVAPAGIPYAEEWFYYAADVRLNGVEALNAAVNEFPAARQILAQPVSNADAANNELDAFFMASNSLRGHIAREYFEEDVFGLGFSYVTEGEPGTLFDQMIINVEASYTPDKTFTATNLTTEFMTDDDFSIALIAEKYQRISPDFPATYFVFQAMHRSTSDLFGRHLSGYGSRGQEELTPGIDSANYLVFAFLQPWPAYIWELSAAALIDVKGGMLLQPALRWKPRGDITVDVFYNYLDGDAWGDNPNDNLLSTIGWADEVALRLQYQF